MPELIVFFDGRCPLCVIEIEHLQRLNSERKLSFEDIFHASFAQRFPHINLQSAEAILHGQLASGKIIKALDVTYLAWSLVGKRRWVAVLRWPIIGRLANICYSIFAKHRKKITSVLQRQPICASCESDKDLT